MCYNRLVMVQKQNFRKAFHLTVPIFFGYVSIGIPFGLMVVNAGYPWWLALFMCLTIFSGTGQYMGIGLMAAGASLPAFLITQFFVGIRHIVYGLSLLKKFVAEENTFLVPFPFILNVIFEN